MLSWLVQWQFLHRLVRLGKQHCSIAVNVDECVLCDLQRGPPHTQAAMRQSICASAAKNVARTRHMGPTATQFTRQSTTARSNDCSKRMALPLCQQQLRTIGCCSPMRCKDIETHKDIECNETPTAVCIEDNGGKDTSTIVAELVNRLETAILAEQRHTQETVLNLYKGAELKSLQHRGFVITDAVIEFEGMLYRNFLYR